jgi:hypothetical protein
MSNELDQLAGIAAEADTAAAPPELTPDGQPVQPAAAINYATEAAAAVDMFAGLVTGYAPATVELWDASTRARVSLALAPVLEKYGVSVGAMPPELLLIVTAGPLLYQTSKLVAAQMHAQKAKAPAADTAAPPAGPAESPGPQIHPQVALYPAK